MFVNIFSILATANPFYQSYILSDFLGKAIFLSLLATSVCLWSFLLHNFFLTRTAKKNSSLFYKAFGRVKNNPLGLENDTVFKGKGRNPFYELYLVLKKQAVDLLNKNRKFGSEGENASYLSSTDIDSIASLLGSAINLETKHLESNLFVLSTIAGLAPLLGILGTVWGILTSLSELGSHAVSSSNQMVLGGISLALTTTVLGLLNAIPALIAFNYLKSSVGQFETEMEGFSNEMLTSVEMQYRKVDLHR